MATKSVSGLKLMLKTSVVSGMTLLSRVLGLVRDIVFARFFGASLVMDAFLVANRIPNMLRRFFAEGAFSQGFVPVMARYREQHDHDDAREFVDAVAGTFGLILFLVTLAGVVVAPLLANDRNTVQGCCPLKVLEAMASGVPLIASDLPVVRALARDGEHALLVRPGSGKAIKDAMLRLGAEPGLRTQLADAARRRIESMFTWRRSGAALVELYREMLTGSAVDLSPGI